MATKPTTFHPSGQSQAERTKRYDNTGARAVDRSFYWSTAWRKYREGFLLLNPWCEWCMKESPPHYALATQVDHRIPRVERPDLSFDPNNCRGACASCHAKFGAKRNRPSVEPSPTHPSRGVDDLWPPVFPSRPIERAEFQGRLVMPGVEKQQ